MSRAIPAAAGAPQPRTTRLLQLAFALSVGTLLWSFVGGAVYLLDMRGSLPLRTDELTRAREQAALGDVAGAAKEYRIAARINGGDIRAVYELGTMLLRNGRTDEANVELELAMREHPRDARVLATMGDVRRVQRRLPEAIGLYQQALDRSPREPALLNNLGTAYAEMGDLDRAIAAYRESAAIAPGPASKNLERALKERAAAAAATARQP
jgi:tetratricopeptide (TPR) repeat protein